MYGRIGGGRWLGPKNGRKTGVPSPHGKIREFHSADYSNRLSPDVD